MAIVAPARKILCILYHLLINQEMYEEVVMKPKSQNHRNPEASSPREMTLEEMIKVVRQSGYEVSQKGGACG